jgi:ABC-2 type transport system ATP-binding protein
MKDVPSKAAIVFDNLRIVYAARSRSTEPKVAVKGLNLTISEGEVFGFLGPNGAGKTSTMNVLLGFLRPTSGTARINGVDISEARSRQALGYLPELTYYYKFLNAIELLHFYGKLFGLNPSDREKRINELLKLVELTEAAKRPIRTYSKGMQQRVGIAQALINDPKVLIMDEPTSGLDPLGRNKVRSIIQRLKEQGKTVFFSSHELGEVETVCDRVAILSGGEVKVLGTVDELMKEHQCSLEQLFIQIVAGDLALA